VRYELINRIIVSWDIWSNLVTYAAISCYHFDGFCRSLFFLRAVYRPTLTFCASSLPQVRKCNNVRHPYELPDFWPSNSPDLNTVYYKISGNESTRQKRRMWVIWGGVWVWLMCSLEWNRTLLTMALRSRLHGCIRATGGYFEYLPWHKLAKTLLTIRNEVKIYSYTRHLCRFW